MEHAHADACADEQVIHGPVREGGTRTRRYKPRKTTRISYSRRRHATTRFGRREPSTWKLLPLIFLSRKSSAADDPGLAEDFIPRSPRPRSSLARGSPICFVRQVLVEMAQAIIALLTLCGVEQGSISVHQARCGLLDATRNALVRPRSAATNHDGGPDDHDGPG